MTDAQITYAEAQEYLTDEEKAELSRLLASDTRLFLPLPGPQHEAAVSRANIIGYGGAAGGGKTYLISGLAMTEHKRSVIFRQHKNQTQKFVQDFGKMLGSGDGYSSQNSQWKIPFADGEGRPAGIRLIEFAGLEDPADHQKWQGRDHDLKCVGTGTMVWMAGGARRAIETIQIGDMVETLEGPRRVVKTMSFRKSAVEIRTAWGSQVQSTDHQILTPDGWLSADDVRRRSAFSFATSRRFWHRVAELCAVTFSRLASTRVAQYPAEEPRPELLPDRADRRASSAESAGRVRTVLEIAFAACSENIRAAWPRVLFLPPAAALQRPLPPAEGCASGGHAAQHDARGGLLGSSLRDLPDRYSFDPHPRDARPRPFAAAGLPDLRQPVGAGARSPKCLLMGDPRQTPRHSRCRWSWVHPYTREKRRTDLVRRTVSFRLRDVGVQPLYDLTVEGANHYLAGAGFVNRNCYDEATQMREADVRYTMGWCRSDDPDQRCRVLMTFNPPTTAEGRWVIRFFAPWLDKTHPNPAREGELRWFTTIDGNQDYEVPDDRPFVRDPETGEFDYEFDPADYPGAMQTQIIRPKSRTFFTAKVTDNPYYMATGYMSQLQNLPEPLRSQMLDGDFMAGVEDDARQLIPTIWIEMAMERWKQRTALADFVKGPMTGLGVDAARGGNMGGTTQHVGRDKLTICPRHGTFFDQVIAIPGIDVNTGNLAGAQILARRRDDAPVQLDVASIGTSIFDALRENQVYVIPLNGTARAYGMDKSNLLSFFNMRAKLHWRLMEALDPAGPEPICLPPDAELLADLAAPRWELTSSGIRIEAKDEIKKRIGRSPDKGEAVIYANVNTPPRQFSSGVRYELPPGIRRESYDDTRLRELE